MAGRSHRGVQIAEWCVFCDICAQARQEQLEAMQTNLMSAKFERQQVEAQIALVRQKAEEQAEQLQAKVLQAQQLVCAHTLTHLAHLLCLSEGVPAPVRLKLFAALPAVISWDSGCIDYT